MGARCIPRPSSGTPTDANDVYAWLVYMCVNSDCRGVGGHELTTTALVSMRLVDGLTGSANRQERARALRDLLVASYASRPDTDVVPADRAIAHLLGLLPRSARQPRPIRRQLAADAMGMTLDTFQRRYEKRLLRDVADELWRREQTAGTATNSPWSPRL